MVYISNNVPCQLSRNMAVCNDMFAVRLGKLGNWFLCGLLHGNIFLKTPDHSLGIQMRGVKISQENLNNCVIKYKLYLPCASFEEKCAQTTTFSKTLFNLRGNHFLVHRTEKGFTSVFMHFSSF